MTTEFRVHWENHAGDETYSRTFDRIDYAERHAEDMHAWGYNVDVLDADNTIILSRRIGASSSKGKKRYSIVLRDAEEIRLPKLSIGVKFVDNVFESKDYAQSLITEADFGSVSDWYVKEFEELTWLFESVKEIVEWLLLSLLGLVSLLMNLSLKTVFLFSWFL